MSTALKINNQKINRRVVVAISVAVVLLIAAAFRPAAAHAQAAGISPGVPINTGTDFNTTMQYLKSFQLDHIATLIAKQILHQMTVSVINWINSGFQGSPAFLTNPQGFFLNAADQITGAFIASNGPLSGLCSPFNVDIRLNIALDQASTINQTYACTLSTIIQNAQNTHVNVSVGDTSSANASDAMNNFLDGDFSQGGWGGFMGMTLSPQNNVYGAYLQAQSDLAAQINTKQASINADLTMGNGFLSYQNCTDITSQVNNSDPEELGLSQNQFDQLNQSGNQAVSTAAGSDIQKTTSSDASGNTTTTYQSCETQTPGSVISGTLQKQLDVPADELELANDINSVIDALVSQLVSQMLSAGLHSLSGASNNNVSFTSQLQNETTQLYNQQIQSVQTQGQNSANQAIAGLQQYKSYYDQAIAAVTVSLNAYEAAESCLQSDVTTLSSADAEQASADQSQISLISGAVSNNVQPLLKSLTGTDNDIEAQITGLQNPTLIDNSGLQTSADIQQQENAYSSSLQNITTVNTQIPGELNQGQQDLTNATTKATQWNVDAAKYQDACQAATP